MRTFVIATALAQEHLLDPTALQHGGSDAMGAWLETVVQTLLDRGLVTRADLESALAQQVAAAAARDVH